MYKVNGSLLCWPIKDCDVIPTVVMEWTNPEKGISGQIITCEDIGHQRKGKTQGDRMFRATDGGTEFSLRVYPGWLKKLHGEISRIGKAEDKLVNLHDRERLWVFMSARQGNLEKR